MYSSSILFYVELLQRKVSPTELEEDIIKLLSRGGWVGERNSFKSHSLQGFPGGPVVKSPPANAGDVAAIPGLGASISWGTTKPACLNRGACALEPGNLI